MFGKRKRARQSHRLPSDTVDRMSQFGQFEFAPMDSSLDGDYVWEQLQAPFLPHTEDPDRFVTDLASVVLPVGGWSAYGAHRTIASLLSPTTQHPAYDRIRVVALHFLRDEGFGAESLNDYERQFWQRTEGSVYPDSAV